MRASSPTQWLEKAKASHRVHIRSFFNQWRLAANIARYKIDWRLRHGDEGEGKHEQPHLSGRRSSSREDGADEHQHEPRALLVRAVVSACELHI